MSLLKLINDPVALPFWIIFSFVLLHYIHIPSKVIINNARKNKKSNMITTNYYYNDPIPFVVSMYTLLGIALSEISYLIISPEFRPGLCIIIIIATIIELFNRIYFFL